MTAFGKMLVFIQFILSMVLASWTIVLYNQRIDWAPARTIMGDPVPDSQGEVKQLASQIEELMVHRDLAETRWQLASQGLVDATESREGYQAWYADQLSLAKTGEDTKGRKMEDPVRQLVYNADGTLKMDNDPKVRPPVLSFGKAVKSVDAYLRDSDKLHKDIETAQDDLFKAVEEAARITADIVGSPVKYGLRREVRDQRAYYSNAKDEYLYLEPLYNGRTAEYEVVLKRNAQLRGRAQELSAAAANR